MTTLSGTLADDAYHSVAELCGLTSSGDVVLVEGFLYALTNGLTWRYGGETVPGTSESGGTIAASAGINVGPVSDAQAGWDLRYLWVRNTTAGSNATVIVSGRVA